MFVQGERTQGRGRRDCARFVARLWGYNSDTRLVLIGETTESYRSVQAAARILLRQQLKSDWLNSQCRKCCQNSKLGPPGLSSFEVCGNAGSELNSAGLSWKKATCKGCTRHFVFGVLARFCPFLSQRAAALSTHVAHICYKGFYLIWNLLESYLRIPFSTYFSRRFFPDTVSRGEIGRGTNKNHA